MDPITAAALAAFASKAAARFGGQQLANKIADLARLQQAELVLLHELRADIDRVVAEPFFTATRLIEDANQPWRTDEDRMRLLHEARGSLTRALAMDAANPLRRSFAALLLAGVWSALGQLQDAALRVVEAHDLAVAAARKIADAEPRPSGRIRTILGMPRKHQPGSIRIRNQSSVSVLGLTLVRVDTYVATRSARRAEAELCEINRYIAALRAVRVSFREADDSLPDFEVRLVPSYKVRLRPIVSYQSSSQLYGLQFTEVDRSTETADLHGDAELSKDRPRLTVTFFPSWRAELSLRSQFPFVAIMRRKREDEAAPHQVADS